MRKGWESARLREVCTLDKAKHDGSALPYVGMEHIEGGGAGRFVEEPAPTEVKSSTFRFSPDHLLYGRLRPYLNKLIEPDFEGHCSTEIFPIRCSSTIDRRYLFYWLSAEPTVVEINRTCTGARMPRANMNEVFDFEIPLPPLAEQKRIVAILDEAFEAIERARRIVSQSITATRQLHAAAVAESLSVHGETWARRRVADVAQTNLGKMLDKGKNRGTPKPYLRNLNVRWFDFNLDDLIEMRFEDSEAEKYTAVRGDLLICEGGYPGRAAIWNRDDSIHFQKAIHRVRCHEAEHNRWLMHYLYYLNATEQLKNHFTGAGIQHFTGRSLKALEVPFPSAKECRELCAKFDAIQQAASAKCRVDTERSESIEMLTASLLSHAFRGGFTSSTATTSVDAVELHAGVLALAYQEHRRIDNAKTFGRVKAEKIAHMAEALDVVDLWRQPTKQAAGPADIARFELVREYAETNNYFRFVPRPGKMKGYTFEPLSDFDTLVKQVSPHFDRSALKPIFDLLAPVKSSEAELIATAYAAWNNLLLDGADPGDDEIVRAARDEWHADKQKYTVADFKAAIRKLREKDLAPDGAAKRVGDKPQAGLWDQGFDRVGDA